jgi:hypothetical protein
MNSIWRRLIYFGIGLSIGLLFVLVLFGTRGCNWLPENRIKASIFSQIVVLDTNELSSQLSDKNYVDLISKGNVNLGLSMRNGNPKAYYFSNDETLNEPHFFQVVFESDAVVAIFKPIKKNEKAKDHINDLWLPIVHVPGDSSFISFHEDITNEIRSTGLSRKDIHDALLENGQAQTIPIELDGQKRKIHRFTFKIGSTSYDIRARIFQSALQILYIQERIN